MKIYSTKQEKIIESMRKNLIALDEENTFLRNQLEIINSDAYLRKIEEMEQVIKECKESNNAYQNAKRKYETLCREMISLKNNYINKMDKIL